jgi:preprotein translocase SecF subunit
VVSIAAMVVNVIITLGFYALMGILQGWEADALFLTALLTVIGFSVQDVIVVFDRMRENIPRHRGEPFELIVNRSVLETVHRSLATQLNAMFVMIAILLFGGATIKPFIAVMLVGMISETFTSLCVAVPLLVTWEEYVHKRALAHAAA